MSLKVFIGLLIAVYSFILSLPAQSMSMNEKISANIVGVFPGNLVVLDRGVEDGIYVRSHVKMISSSGYIARALCVKSGMLSSHWKLYRILDADQISKDISYTLISLQDSELPHDIDSFADKDLRNSIPDFDESKLPSAPPTADLPTNLQSDFGFVRDKKTGMLSRKIIQKSHLVSDLQRFHGEAYISPYAKQSINNSEALNLGGKIQNKGRKYLASLSYDKEKTSLTDPTTNEDVTYSQDQFTAQAEIKNYFEDLDLISSIEFRKTRFGKLKAPSKHIITAPLGIRYNLNHHLSFSYAPAYDHRVTERLNGNQIIEDEVNTFRHIFSLTGKFKLGPKVEVSNTFFYRPAQSSGSYALEPDNSLIENDLNIAYLMGQNLSIEYQHRYSDDLIRNTKSNLPRVNTLYSMLIRYRFDL